MKCGCGEEGGMWGKKMKISASLNKGS